MSGREKEYGTDIAYDIRESRAETSVISDAGGRDERSVREADETDNVSQSEKRAQTKGRILPRKTKTENMEAGISPAARILQSKKIRTAFPLLPR